MRTTETSLQVKNVSYTQFFTTFLSEFCRPELTQGLVLYILWKNLIWLTCLATRKVELEVELRFSQTMCKLMSGGISCCKNSGWDESNFTRKSFGTGKYKGEANHRLKLVQLWYGSVEWEKNISKSKGLIKDQIFLLSLLTCNILQLAKCWPTFSVFEDSCWDVAWQIT